MFYNQAAHRKSKAYSEASNNAFTPPTTNPDPDYYLRCFIDTDRADIDKPDPHCYPHCLIAIPADTDKPAQ